MYCVRTRHRALSSQQRPCRIAANREPQKHVRPDGPHRAAHAHVPAPQAAIHTDIIPRHMAPVPRPRNSATRSAATATIQMEPHVLRGRYMKKIILVAVAVSVMAPQCYAACTANAKTYTACKPGYYLNSGKCTRCPSSGETYGTTVDNNTGGITSCYIPSGTSFSDTSGAGTYTGDCYYKN